jgi:hypothetical protein
LFCCELQRLRSYTLLNGAFTRQEEAENRHNAEVAAELSKVTRKLGDVGGTLKEIKQALSGINNYLARQDEHFTSHVETQRALHQDVLILLDRRCV